ncbi:ferredoxin-type protein NapF [Luteimonas terricola]|uniref:ferredoxin-type protein NapF n=1 Tax=Luteimonas terricola TaxID=645597 RepID=UPI001049FAB6|nr:ferredoxin-type protein NapF [Luteimonas terricola]
MNHRPDRSRRALLQGRLRARPLLRPPWALDESLFVDACTGCNACVAACPEAVLLAGEGGLPEFDPARGECTFCGDCASACRESAFGPLSDPPWTLRAQVGDACLAARGIVCSSCRDACGESAIRFPPTRTVPMPQVDADRCTGCGACVQGCPATAISLAPLVAEMPVEA